MEQPSVCAKCNEQINDAKCVIVGEKYYHENHFTCSSCSADLSTQQYHQENDDDYYCVDCYSKNIAPKCAACGLAILENIVQLADGVELHNECFVCFKCKKCLTAEYVQDEDKHIVCNECLENSVDKCDSCQKPILDCKITTGGKKFHQSCFKCSKCDSVIEQENHLEQDGQIFHARCLNLQCSFCNEIILSGYYKYQDLLYHIECYEKAKLQLQEEQGQNNNNNTEQLLADVREEVEKEELKLKEEEEQKRKQHEQEEEARKQYEEEKKEQEKKLELEMEKQKQNQNQKENDQQLVEKQTIQDQQNDVQGKKNLSNIIKQFETNSSQVKETQTKSNDNKSHLKVEEPKIEAISNAPTSNQSEPISYKVIPYSVLTSNPPSDIDFTKKEAYLSDEEFQKVFQMNKQEFGVLKAWRQKELKQKHKLF
ncbi:hypothetical protein ABPG74_003360 [Tetrahymena malaccensis]